MVGRVQAFKPEVSTFEFISSFYVTLEKLYNLSEPQLLHL